MFDPDEGIGSEVVCLCFLFFFCFETFATFLFFWTGDELQPLKYCVVPRGSLIRWLALSSVGIFTAFDHL